jgi:monofunctional biosynthetic peptidoglycan transglycosylase
MFAVAISACGTHARSAHADVNGIMAISSRQSRAGRLPFRVLRAALVAVLVVLLLPYALAPLYRFGHPVSALMMWRWIGGKPVSREWVDLDRISPHLVRTVVVAEDGRFCSHRGIDWNALRDVIEDAQEGDVTFGGSTITQQTVKNLFLWPGRSVLRKGLEIPLALWFDLVLPKRRVLEIYLNIAEWGPADQFGAEAGARHAFAKGASNLSPGEAALMAAVLPNPRKRSAARPAAGVQRKAAVYLSRASLARDVPPCLARPG